MFIALLTRERKTSGKACSELEFHPPHSSWFCHSKEGFVNSFPPRCVGLWLSAISSLPICRFHLFWWLVFSCCSFLPCTSVFICYWIWGDLLCELDIFYFAEVLGWIQPTMCLKNKTGDHQKMSELSTSVQALRKNRFCLKALWIISISCR